MIDSNFANNVATRNNMNVVNNAVQNDQSVKACYLIRGFKYRKRNPTSRKQGYCKECKKRPTTICNICYERDGKHIYICTADANADCLPRHCAEYHS